MDALIAWAPVFVFFSFGLLFTVFLRRYRDYRLRVHERSESPFKIFSFAWYMKTKAFLVQGYIVGLLFIAYSVYLALGLLGILHH
jgi:hypothetical protein